MILTIIYIKIHRLEIGGFLRFFRAFCFIQFTFVFLQCKNFNYVGQNVGVNVGINVGQSVSQFEGQNEGQSPNPTKL